MNLRSLGNEICPPALLRFARRLQGDHGSEITFQGNYGSWKDAMDASSGYGTRDILTRTRDALLKVKHGEAAFERDSVAFNKMHYNFPLLAGLLRAAALNKGRLSILDFGGSLGGTYFQSRFFLSCLKDVQWSVVDQPLHVECGEADFANDQLHFYRTVEECFRVHNPNVLLLLSVLQYLPEPYNLLTSLLGHQFTYIIIERTAFTVTNRDRLTVQNVPPAIYKASYPAWFLSESRVREILKERYDLVCELPDDEKYHPKGEAAVFKSFQFQLR